jgi:hypothetical protein
MNWQSIWSRLKLLYGTENALRTVLRLVSETRSRIDACMDHTGPSLAVEIEGVRESIVSRTLYYKQYLNLNPNPKDEDRPHSASSWF